MAPAATSGGIIGVIALVVKYAYQAWIVSDNDRTNNLAKLNKSRRPKKGRR